METLITAAAPVSRKAAWRRRGRRPRGRHRARGRPPASLRSTSSKTKARMTGLGLEGVMTPSTALFKAVKEGVSDGTTLKSRLSQSASSIGSNARRRGSLTAAHLTAAAGPPGLGSQSAFGRGEGTPQGVQTKSTRQPLAMWGPSLLTASRMTTPIGRAGAVGSAVRYLTQPVDSSHQIRRWARDM